jgi:hypothetical protein
MATLELCARGWRIAQLALDELKAQAAVVDGVPVTMAEFNYVYDNLVKAMGEDLLRIEMENQEHQSHFSADDAEAEARHKMQLAAAKKYYTGIERRKG